VPSHSETDCLNFGNASYHQNTIDAQVNPELTPFRASWYCFTRETFRNEVFLKAKEGAA
jgi:hypothetical protein